MTLVTALLKYFGKKEGETLASFSEEFKKLTAVDREDLRVMLEKELGIPIDLEA